MVNNRTVNRPAGGLVQLVLACCCCRRQVRDGDNERFACRTAQVGQVPALLKASLISMRLA